MLWAIYCQKTLRQIFRIDFLIRQLRYYSYSFGEAINNWLNDSEVDYETSYL